MQTKNLQAVHNNSNNNSKVLRQIKVTFIVILSFELHISLSPRLVPSIYCKVKLFIKVCFSLSLWKLFERKFPIPEICFAWNSRKLFSFKIFRHNVKWKPCVKPINPFSTSFPLLYPLEHIRKPEVFWCFQGV